VEVLDDEEDRAGLGGPFQEAHDGLGDRGRPSIRPDPEGHPRLDRRDDVGEQHRQGIRSGPYGARPLRVGQAREMAAQAADHRGVGLEPEARVGPPAQDGEGLGEAGDPAGALVDEAAHADAPGTGDEDAPALARRRCFEGDGDPRELSLPTHEPRARQPAGHGGIVPHGATRDPIAGARRIYCREP
jgi:hypothetical protein